MSTELEFAALHSDDLLLDTVGGRREVTAADPVAGLLAAFAADVDTRPIPAERPQLSAIPAQGMQDPPPPVVLPLRKRVVAGRAAAMATAGAIVLGVGGMSAAVAGAPGFAPITEVVSSVADRVTPESSSAEKVAKLLRGARDAIERGETKTAGDLLADARAQLAKVTDEQQAAQLQGQLRALQAQLQAPAPASATAAVPGSAAATERSAADADRPRSRPGPQLAIPGAERPAATGSTLVDESSAPSQSPDELLPGSGIEDPTERLDLPREPGLGDAKKRLEDKADEQIDERVPEDLQDPVGKMRNSTKDGLLVPGPFGLLYNAGGDVLAHPEAGAVVSDLTDGTNGSGSTR